jgi:asparagine synthetase B (glutamine-hydrolysing)
MTLRDWHGLRRAYARDGSIAGTLRELVHPPRVLDRDGVLAAWGERDDPFSTVIAGVRQLPCRARAPRMIAWVEAFEAAVASLARTARDPMLALGGGIDAAAVLIAWRASGLPLPVTCTIATGLTDYDEVDCALVIARVLDTPCEVIDVPPEQLVALAPAAAIVAETPLYNLHPVHRLALVREAHRRGAATLVTGDGADAVFAGSPDLDYVPIVAALTHSAGVALASPFFEDAIVDGTAPDPSKLLVADYLRANGLGELADRPKRPRFLPALELAPILDRDHIGRLARELDMTPALASDRERVGWATLAHLVSALEAR